MAGHAEAREVMDPQDIMRLLDSPDLSQRLGASREARRCIARLLADLETARRDIDTHAAMHGVTVRVLERTRADLEAARETNARLNRRCQEAERALPDYAKLIALPPNGDGVRFVSGSLGRALLASLAARQERDIEAATKRAEAAERDAARLDWLRKQVQAGKLLIVGGPFMDDVIIDPMDFDADLDAARAAGETTK